MRRSLLLVALGACSFDHGSLTSGHDASCGETPWWDASYAHRAHITHAAPAGYTLELDASAVLQTSFTSTRNDVRVVVDHASEVDRILSSSTLSVKVPAEGDLWIYSGNISPDAPKADPAGVYLFAESFEGFPVGDHVTARFEPYPPTEWNVVDDLGNHVYRALGASRHPAAIAGLAMTRGDIRARLRWGLGGSQQHNGLAALGNSMVPATMDGLVDELQADISQVRIAEYHDGASPPNDLLVQPFTVVRGQWYELRMQFFDDLVNFSVDGTLLESTSARASDGKHVGLYAHDTDVDYDDVRVRMLLLPEPAAAIGADEPRCL